MRSGKQLKKGERWRRHLVFGIKMLDDFARTGMHLLQSGVSLEIIRNFLGHVDVMTTQIFARANLELKRRPLAKVADDTPLPSLPSWQQNKTLLDWLHSL